MSCSVLWCPKEVYLVKKPVLFIREIKSDLVQGHLQKRKVKKERILVLSFTCNVLHGEQDLVTG